MQEGKNHSRTMLAVLPHRNKEFHNEASMMNLVFQNNFLLSCIHLYSIHYFDVSQERERQRVIII